MKWNLTKIGTLCILAVILCHHFIEGYHLVF